MTTGTPLESIRNIGPATASALRAAGIPDAESLRALGADAAYARLLAGGMRPHFIGYYVMVMGLQGRPWNDARGEEKAALRRRFDALRAGHAPPPEAEGAADLPGGLLAALDALGVRAPRRG